MFARLKEGLAKARKELGRTFRSLKDKNYRMYTIGQLVSTAGTWMQSVALSWTTYTIAHSASVLALVGFASNVPLLVLGLVAGVIADRYNRQKVLFLTQFLFMLSSGTLAYLAFTGVLSIGMIVAFTIITGVISAFESPTRQAFVADMVGKERSRKPSSDDQGNSKDDLVNVVALNSVVYQTTRLLGPALAAIVLAWFGASVCFALNALSFSAALIAIYRIRIDGQNVAQAKAKRKRPSIKAGLQLVAKTPLVRNALILTSATSFLGFQIFVLLPVFVGDVLKAGAGTLGMLTSCSAAGALLGGLFMASRGKGAFLKRGVGYANLGLAGALICFSLSRNLYLSAAIEVFIGLFMTLQLSSTNSLLQLTVDEEFRGRIMSLYSMALFGIAPLGNLVMAKFADLLGAPLTLFVSAILCALAAIVYLGATRTKRMPQ